MPQKRTRTFTKPAERHKFSMISHFTGKRHTRSLYLTPKQRQQWSWCTRPLDQCFPWLSLDDRCFLLFGATEPEWEQFLTNDDAKVRPVKPLRTAMSPQ